MKPLLRLFVAAALTAATLVAAPAATPPAAAEGFGRARAWSGWFAPGQETPLVGDVDGDGRDDLVSFVQDAYGAGHPAEGEVWVARSTGSGYAPATKWHDRFGTRSEVPALGDVDGDGDDDAVLFTRDEYGTGKGRGTVLVALSSRTGFGTAAPWASGFAVGQELPLVGDFDGDGRDDVASFARDAAAEPARGDVRVARSTGTGFAASTLWHPSFALRGAVPAVGDVDGDGRDDVVSFTRGTAERGAAQGDVHVGISSAGRFAVTKWHDFFAIGDEVPAVGDVDGDRRADVVTFLRGTTAEPGRNDAYVAFSGRSGFSSARLWHDSFAWGDELPMLGDANGDAKSDALAFLKDTQPEPRRADVMVSLSGEPSPPATGVTAADFGHGSMTVYGKPALGTRPLLVVLVDFRDARFAPDRGTAYWQDRFFAGPTNVGGFFREMSGGRFGWRSAGVVGPYRMVDDPATGPDESTVMCAYNAGTPPPCPGSSSNENAVRTAAVAMAAVGGFDFAPYDTNPRDGRVTAAELQVQVVDAQNASWGANRTSAPECVPLPGQPAVCTGWVSLVSQQTDFQTVAHELAHSLGTTDVYGGGCNSQNLSLMSCTGGEQPVHLDPWHKIQLGWVEPRTYSLVESGSCAVLHAASWASGREDTARRPVLVFDPRGDRSQYFLLEYRNPSAWSGVPTYDRAAAGTGLAVWQVRTAGRADYGAVQRVEPATVPTIIVFPGPDGVLQSTVAPGSDDVRQLQGDGTTLIFPGPDRILQSTASGDDQIPPETAVFTFTPGGARGVSTLFTRASGVVAPQYVDRTPTELRVQAGDPAALPGSLAVKWTLHSFRGAMPAARLADANLRSCYQRVP